MMKIATKTVLFALICASLAAPACKKGKETETPVDKTPSGPPAPSGTISLHGIYTQQGSVGSIQDCTTGDRWPVSDEGDSPALEQAYRESGVEPGPLVVTVEGGIDYRPRPNGSGREMMFIVARFVQVGPGERCESVR